MKLFYSLENQSRPPRKKPLSDFSVRQRLFGKQTKVFCNRFCQFLSPRTPVEEEHAEEDEQEVEDLALEVLLAEEQGTTEERHEHTATTHHGDDGNERVGLLEGGKIGKVGHAEEERDEGDGPRPMEGSALLALGVPQHEEHHAHDEALVEGEPRLHHHAIELAHEELIVQGAHGTEQRGQRHTVDPTVVAEVDALLLAATAQQHKRYHSQQYAYPLIGIEPLAKEEQRTKQYHHRTRGIDGAYDGDGQMLHTKVAEEP